MISGECCRGVPPCAPVIITTMRVLRAHTGVRPYLALDSATYMSEASLKKGVSRQKELDTTIGRARSYELESQRPLVPRPCRGGDRGGVGDYKEGDKGRLKVMCA